MPSCHCKYAGHLIVILLSVKQSITQLLLKLKPKNNVSFNNFHSKTSLMGSKRILHLSGQLISAYNCYSRSSPLSFKLQHTLLSPHSQRMISSLGFQWEKKGYHIPTPTCSQHQVHHPASVYILSSFRDNPSPELLSYLSTSSQESYTINYTFSILYI